MLRQKLIDTHTLIQNWVIDFKQGIEHVEAFYMKKKEELKYELENLKEKLNKKIKTDKEFEKIIKTKEDKYGFKDELQEATSWTRAFAEINRGINWLDSYCRINFLSSRKIIKKFIKCAQIQSAKTILTSFVKRHDFVEAKSLREIEKGLINTTAEYSLTTTKAKPKTP